ncbi:MAG TPA: ABC transporter permease, partial [bacterium]|nr:ABC transporter permease [bacterium]
MTLPAAPSTPGGAIEPKARARRAGGRVRPAKRRPSGWRHSLVSVAALLAVLAAWQGIVVVFHVPVYLAPSPLMVVHALRAESHTLLVNTWPTLIETVGGFIVGNLIAIVAAVGFVHNRIFRQSVYPLAVTVRTLPIVAISPILVLLLGNGYAPKIAIAALITFFPTLVNMADGLTAVDPQALELMHVLSASRWEVFRYLRWPTSLPYLFSALRIASTASLLGAIVGEWIGSNSGLG